MEANQNSIHKLHITASQIKQKQDSLLEPINIQKRYVSKVHYNIYRARLQLRLTTRNASELRKRHLLTRVSVMNIDNRNQDAKTIINLQRI